MTSISKLRVQKIFPDLIVENKIENVREDADIDWKIVSEWMDPHVTDDCTPAITDAFVNLLEKEEEYYEDEDSEDEGEGEEGVEDRLLNLYKVQVKIHYDSKVLPQIPPFPSLQEITKCKFTLQTHIELIINLLDEAQKLYFSKLEDLKFTDDSHIAFEVFFGVMVNDSLKYLFPVLARILTSGSPGANIQQHLYMNDFFQMLSSYGTPLSNQVNALLGTLICSELYKHITIYAKLWHEPILPLFTSWLSKSLVSLILNFIDIDTENEEDIDLLEILIETGMKKIMKERILQSYDLVVDYPNSISALEEMDVWLITPKQRADLATVFIRECFDNLLHSGTNTSDIITFYISVIRSFSIIDPKLVLLDKVKRPIRKYLKDRDDTIENIVSGLIGESSDTKLNELYEALKAHKNLQNKKEPPQTDEFTMEWSPDPVDTLPDFKTNKQDIIESLVSLYDNNAIFVSEFVRIFNTKLLQTNHSDTLSEIERFDKIIFDLSLLKSKFGKEEFQVVDVMIQDIRESKKLDKTIHKKNEEINNIFHMNILSRMFWSELDYGDLVLPSDIISQYELYSKTFSETQNSRSLKLLPKHGVVTVCLELEDRVVELDITPEQAVFIKLFEEKSEISLDDITTHFENQISSTEITKLLTFWHKEKVIMEFKTNWYKTVEKLSDLDNEIQDVGHNDAGIVEEDSTDNTISKMGYLFPFINGMLKNLGTLPIDRIHSFLGIVVPPETPYMATKDQLKNYMESLVEEDEIEKVGDSYKLKK